MGRWLGDWGWRSAVAAGALLLFLAWLAASGEARFAAASERVLSTVTEMPTGGPDDNNPSYGRAAFDYRGRRHEIRFWPGSGSGTLPENSVVGDRQGLFVPEGQPGRARIADWQNRYLLKAMLAGFGVVVIFIGLAVRAMALPDHGSALSSSTAGMAFAFLFLGLSLGTATGAAAWSHKRWIDASTGAMGVANSELGAARVTYTPRGGSPVTVRADWLPTAMPPDRPRIAVPIRYHLSEPDVIRPYAGWALWDKYVYVGGLALAFCAIPLLGLWLMWRWEKIAKKEDLGE